MSYRSEGDESAFYGWLQSIRGVRRVEGRGRTLIITLKSRRLSATSLRELLALYRRYGGRLSELAEFETGENRRWFRDAGAWWFRGVFGKGVPPNKSLERTRER
jgi:hypothetical protein